MSDFRSDPEGLSLVETLELSDDRTEVSLEKVRTRNGERLAITDEASGRSIRLDAIELESLSWQRDLFFQELLGVSGRDVSDAADIDLGDRGIFVANEYAQVLVQPVRSRSDEVGVTALKLEYFAVVRAAELAALVTKDTAFFSDLLHTPLGPRHSH